MKSCAALFLFHEKVTKWKINRIIVELKEYAGSRGEEQTLGGVE